MCPISAATDAADTFSSLTGGHVGGEEAEAAAAAAAAAAVAAEEGGEEADETDGHM